MPKSVARFWLGLVNQFMGNGSFALSVPLQGSWGSWCPPVPLLYPGWKLGREPVHLASGADTLGHSKARDVYSASQVYLSVSLLSLPLFFCLPLPPPSLLLAFISCITMQFFSLMFLVCLKRYMTCNAPPTWRDSEPTACLL